MIISTWRRPDLLRCVLAALTKQTLPVAQFEVVVCDSGSNDGTADVVEQLRRAFPHFQYLDIQTNTASAKRNAAAAAAHAPILVLLDDDAVPEATFLEAHLAAHRAKPGEVVCGEVFFPNDWVRTSNYFRFRASRYPIAPSASDANHDDPMPVRQWATMNLSLSARLVKTHGLMDESFLRYGCEDHEFASRYRRAGIGARLISGAGIVHWEGNHGIDQYAKKIYYTSRFGIPLLLAKAPEFIQETRLRHLEAALGRTGISGTLMRAGGRLLLGRGALRFAIMVARVTDRWPLVYSPLLFRYISTAAHLSGARDRNLPATDKRFFDA